jgi:hypothetical protein
MTTLLVQHQVESYDAWKPFFDGHQDNRKMHGATGHRVLRDGNAIAVLIDFPDSASAASFVGDPALKEAMANSGVVGAPTIALTDETEQTTY